VSTDVFGTGDTLAADKSLKSLDALTVGLGARFGEDELSTVANAARLAYLKNNSAGDKVFAETSFKVFGGYEHDWDIPAGGLDVTVGFDAKAELDSRIIAALGADYANRVGGGLLKSLRNVRSFIFPRSMDDIKAMKPGESCAASGMGKLGLNAGVSVPLLVANPASVFTYDIALTAGIKTVLQGQLDVQVIRLDGDKVVVDVGIDKAKTVQETLAVKSEWGVQGILDPVAHIHGHDLDIGGLVQKAVDDKIGKYITFNIQASSTRVANRLSVTRALFHLDGQNQDEIAAALAQAIRGDVRLAQALYNRDVNGSSAVSNPSVELEWDLSRSGISKVRSFGVDAFGMALLHDSVTTNDGSAVIQTPAGAEGLYWDSLSKSQAGFFRSHGYMRGGIAGLTFKKDAPAAPTGEVNLVLQVQQGVHHLHNAMMLDSLDAAIQSVAGPGAVDALGAGGPLGPFSGAIASVPGDDAQKLLTSAGTDRQALLADGLPVGGLHPNMGPNASVVVDFRLDDGAIAAMVGKSAADMRAALVDYLSAVEHDRVGDPSRAKARARVESEYGPALDDIASTFQARMGVYSGILQRERTTLTLNGHDVKLGSRALAIVYPVDSDNRAQLDKATIGSLSQTRAKVLTAMVDELIKKAQGIDTHSQLNSEDVIIYPLLAISPRERMTVHVKVDRETVDASESDKTKRLDGFSAFEGSFSGPAAAPIGAGVFDVDAIVNATDQAQPDDGG
jgi:hypothetical protein